MQEFQDVTWVKKAAANEMIFLCWSKLVEIKAVNDD